MRRSVFLALWLGLVLSLLKESAADETSVSTTVMTSTQLAESSTGSETAPKPIEAKPEETTDPPAETSPSTTVMTSTETTEFTTGSETATTTTEMTNPTPTDTPAETTASTTVTESSTGNETASAPTEMTTSAPTVLEDFCHGYPCGKNLAKCISLKSNYTCECPYGFYYINENCDRGKVYPVVITVRVSYNESLQTVNSTEYEVLFNKVSAFFQSAFQSNFKGYKQSVIVEIQRPTGRSNTDSLNVRVSNLFMWDSDEDATLVYTAIKDAVEKGNRTYVSSYSATKYCDIYQCDNKTTECQEQMFPECKCKPNLEKTEWDDRSCSACSKSCSAAAHKYCVKEEEGLRCKCMNNFKEKDGNCVACSVGFSGEECSDNSELILIIVGSVFGAIILSLVIAVAIISVRAKRGQNPEKRGLIKSGYSDMNTSEERPSMFPRVQTTSGHANPGYQPNNPYEMRSANRDRFPERDFDDSYEVSREPRGFRMQNRY